MKSLEQQRKERFAAKATRLTGNLSLDWNLHSVNVFICLASPSYESLPTSRRSEAARSNILIYLITELSVRNLSLHSSYILSTVEGRQED